MVKDKEAYATIQGYKLYNPVRLLYMILLFLSANVPNVNMLATEGSNLSSRMTFGCGMWFGISGTFQTLSSWLDVMDNGGWASTIGVSLTRSCGAALMAGSAGGTPFGVMLQIPCHGLFMWPLAVAGPGFKYFKINLLLMFGHPFRKPHLTA